MDIAQLVESRIDPGQDRYLTPGRHIQLIGSQNGSFAPFGHHVPNEMGGVWMQPIKLLDGFWFGTASAAGEVDWLTNAVSYSNHAYYNVMVFERDGMRVERTEYSAHGFAGLIVEFAVTGTSRQATSMDAVIAVHSDLRPVWYSETAGISDGPDQSRIDGGDFLAKDGDNDWYVRCRVDGTNAQLSLSEQAVVGDAVFGSGESGTWRFPLRVEPGETKTVRLKVTGSMTSADETRRRMDLLVEPKRVFADKRRRYAEVVSCADVELPDKELEKQFAWSKCHIEWLTIASEPTGTGLAAGIPEYVWWFSVDSAYALKGFLPGGFHQLAEQTLAILKEGSERANGNGRILHEENSFGVVGNPGNAQETALFIHAAYETYRWTGDRGWIASYWPAITAALRYLLEDSMVPGSLFPVGAGVMEGCGLTGEVIDTAVYTQVALANASEIASMLGETEAAERYGRRAEEMAASIRSVMWLDDEGLFADLRTSAEDMVTVFDHSIERFTRSEHPETARRYVALREELLATHAGRMGERLPFCFKNWVIDTPLEMGIATKAQADTAFARLNSPEFLGQWGAYLAGGEDDRMMTISTAVRINSNLVYGNSDVALDLIRRVMSSFNLYLPGSISEMSPDYGCFVQAWTAYAMIGPVITGFLGLQPDAGNRRMTVRPCLPTGWDFLVLRNVTIGQQTFDFELRRTHGDALTLKIDGPAHDWDVSLSADVTMVSQ